MVVVKEQRGLQPGPVGESRLDRPLNERENHFSLLDWQIMSRVSSVLLQKKIADIKMSSDWGPMPRTPVGRATHEGKTVHLVIEDCSAVPDGENIDTFFEICGLARQFIIRAREKRLSDWEQESLLSGFIEQQAVVSFNLLRVISAFRDSPTGVDVPKLKDALEASNEVITVEIHLWRKSGGKGEKAGAPLSNPPLPLTKHPRVAEVLEKYLRANPFSMVSRAIREEIVASSDSMDLHRELVTEILTLHPQERFSSSDPTAGLRAKDGLIKRIVISAHSGNGLAQKDLIEIYKGISKEGRFYQAVLASEAGSYRRVREGLAEMRDYIVGKIHDCVRKYDKTTEQLVFDYFELVKDTSEERLFLLSTIASLDRGFGLEFYERLLDYCFGGDTEVNSHLRGYAKDRYQRGRLAQATSLNLAIFSMASDFEIAEKCPRYVSSFVADCIRSLFSTDGHVFQSAFTFILGLVNNSLVPADMASAACWRLTNNLGANLGQAEKKKVVLALLGSALTENEGRYPEILQRRNVADILLRLNGFIADQKIGQGFFSPDVVARWGREIQAYRLFRERNPIAGGSDSVWGELTRFKRMLGLG